MHSPRDLDRATLAHLEDISQRTTRLAMSVRRHGYGHVLTTPPEEFYSTPIPRELHAAVDIVRLQLAWKSEPVACSMHPDLMDELGDMEHTKLPSAMFNHLAYRNPRIMFPVPVRCKSVIAPSGHGELIAAQVTGRRWVLDPSAQDPMTAPRLLIPCHSNHPERVRLSVTLINTYDAPGANGMELSNLELPLDQMREFNPQVLIEEFARDETTGLTAKDLRGWPIEQHLDAFRSKFWPALNALMYLSNRKMEAEPAPVRGGSSARRARARDQQPQIHNVGYHRGPELAALRRRWASDCERLRGTGRVLPHPRRAHYRDWPGGREDGVQVFVSATYVNLDLLDGDDLPTIVPVGRME